MCTANVLSTCFLGWDKQCPCHAVCLVTLSLSEAGPGRFGGQVSVIDIYHTLPWVCYCRRNQWLRLALASFCLPLMWLARVVYLLVGVAEGWGGRRGHAYPCAVRYNIFVRVFCFELFSCKGPVKVSTESKPSLDL